MRKIDTIAVISIIFMMITASSCAGIGYASGVNTLRVPSGFNIQVRRIADTAPKGTILVTGGAGYIGSHAVRRYLEEGYNVVILDSLVKGRKFAVDRNMEYAADLHRTLVFEKGDLLDSEFLRGIFERNKIDKVVHLAGLIEVGESVERPALYNYYNIISTLRLSHAMREAGVRELAFASTAAVYDKAELITEETPTNPLSPYGYTKLAMEHIMAAFKDKHGFKWAAMRFFNVAGASIDGKVGEAHFPESHVIPRFIAALLKGETVQVFGTNYDTEDGTNVRDYIHVRDLVYALMLALDLPEESANRAYNLSTGEGTSVLQLLKQLADYLNIEYKWEDKGRRPGDIDKLVALSDAFKKATGWDLKYSDIKTIIETAVEWYRNMPGEASEPKPLPKFKEYELEQKIIYELKRDTVIGDELKEEIIARLQADRARSLEVRHAKALRELVRGENKSLLDGWDKLDDIQKEDLLDRLAELAEAGFGPLRLDRVQATANSV